MPAVTIPLAGYFTSGYPVMGSLTGYPQTYDVPAGQDLVIESMSAFAGVPKGQSANLWLDVADEQKGQVIVTYFIPLQFQATYSVNPTNPTTRVRLAVDESRAARSHFWRDADLLSGHAWSEGQRRRERGCRDHGSSSAVKDRG